MIKHKSIISLGALALCAYSAQGLMLNEIRTDSFGNPDEEYLEIKGTPGESLDDVWMLYIGDHSGTGNFKGSGVVERAIDFTGFTIPDDGTFLMVRNDFEGAALGVDPGQVDMIQSVLGNAFENNDNVTVMLVRGFTEGQILIFEDQVGEAAVDIDDDDDGVPNATLPWTEVIDAVSLVDVENSGDFYYGEAFGGTNLGPTLEGVPWHAFRASDNDQWYAGERELFEENDDGEIIGKSEISSDTPGTENPIAPPETFEPRITAISETFASVGSTFMVEGDNLDIVTDVTINGIAATFTVTDSDPAALEVTVPADATTGPVGVVNPDGEASSVGFIVIVDTANLVFSEDFSEDLGTFSQYSVTSEAVWIHNVFADTTSAYMSGFGTDTASDDWLISPAIDLAGVSDSFFIMGHDRAFSGPPIQVKISTDYSGSGDPSSATWTDLSVTLSDGDMTDTGMVDISAYDGETVYVAVRYVSDGPDSGQGANDYIQYVAVGGEGAALGWQNTNEYGWVYFYSPDVGQSLDLGLIYTDSYPWIYQERYGYLYVVVRVPGVAMWLYDPELGYLYLAEGQGGWFSAQNLNWEYENFFGLHEG
jgi:hypothetical protein